MAPIWLLGNVTAAASWLGCAATCGPAGRIRPGREPGPPSHPEMRAPHGFDGRGGPAHLDLRRVLPAEQVEQQLARRPGDAGGAFSRPGPDGFRGSRPVQLETRAAQPPRQVPGPEADVVPQGLLHGLLVRPGTAAVGPAHVLMVDEELVQARDPAHPSGAEEPGRRPGPERRHEPGEVPGRERCLPPLRWTAPRAGQDEPGAGERVALAQHEVRGDITGGPRREQGRRVGTELVEQAGEPCALVAVEERTGHTAAV